MFSNPGATTFGSFSNNNNNSSQLSSNNQTAIIPSNGSVGFLRKMNNYDHYPQTKDRFCLPSLTTRNEFKGHTLDEIRMKDYFNLKNKTLHPDERSLIKHSIDGNLWKRGVGINELFPDGLPPHLIDIFSIKDFPGNIQAFSTAGSLFMNPQPSPMVINIPTNQPSGLQNSSLPTIKLSRETNITQPPETKELERKTVKPTATTAKSENKALELNSGSFNYEFNKMLFVSGLVQIMEKHNMGVPENLLDNTDFVAQLLEFLEQNDISLPTENIPQFHIDSVTQSLSDDETSE